MANNGVAAVEQKALSPTYHTRLWNPTTWICSHNQLRPRITSAVCFGVWHHTDTPHSCSESAYFTGLQQTTRRVPVTFVQQDGCRCPHDSHWSSSSRPPPRSC